MLLRSLPPSPAHATVSDLSLLFLGGVFSPACAHVWASRLPGGGHNPQTHMGSSPGVSTQAPCVCGSAGVTLLDLPGGEVVGSGQAWFVPKTVAHGRCKEFLRVNWVTPEYIFILTLETQHLWSLCTFSPLSSDSPGELPGLKGTHTHTLSLCWADSSSVDWLIF